jgi:hypothetical protein
VPAHAPAPPRRKADPRKDPGFFGYVENRFIGNGKENGAIQQHLDDGDPEMAGKLPCSHVDASSVNGRSTRASRSTPVRED